jgi:hypothetical protein
MHHWPQHVAAQKKHSRRGTEKNTRSQRKELKPLMQGIHTDKNLNHGSPAEFCYPCASCASVVDFFSMSLKATFEDASPEFPRGQEFGLGFLRFR